MKFPERLCHPKLLVVETGRHQRSCGSGAGHWGSREPGYGGICELWEYILNRILCRAVSQQSFWRTGRLDEQTAAALWMCLNLFSTLDDVAVVYSGCDKVLAAGKESDGRRWESFFWKRQFWWFGWCCVRTRGFCLRFWLCGKGVAEVVMHWTWVCLSRLSDWVRYDLCVYCYTLTKYLVSRHKW